MASVTAPPPVPSAQLRTKWNTQSLSSRISSDLISALCASSLVAPLITLIDKSIIQRTHATSALSQIFTSNLKSALRRPLGFLGSTPFLLINTLYFATYTTANLTDTLMSTLSNKSASNVTAGPAKFLATSAANLSICMYKDARFAKMFGAKAGDAAAASSASATSAASATSPASASTTSSSVSQSSSASTASAVSRASVRSSSTLRTAALALQPARSMASMASAASKAAPRVVPAASLALFAMRDSMTMFASFNVPAVLGPMIGSLAAAQFLAPAGVQFFSTPLHLLGLDLFNRPRAQVALSWKERMGAIKRDWLSASFARMARIVPAYGLGGVVNAGVRKRLMGQLE